MKISRRIFTKAVITFIVAAVLFFTVISGLMINAIYQEPASEATLIVLGCQVLGVTPSDVLAQRLETAYQYLLDKPDAVAILSGGQGPGEWITEAEAMRRYLTARGISKDRLYMEERSTSTYENIVLSQPIIVENKLHQNVAIATDGFHQYRAQDYAKNVGLAPGAVPSRTPSDKLPFYWLREVAAITVQVVFSKRSP